MEPRMVFVSGNNFLTFLAILVCPAFKYLDKAKYLGESCHNYFSNSWVNITNLILLLSEVTLSWPRIYSPVSDSELASTDPNLRQQCPRLIDLKS